MPCLLLLAIAVVSLFAGLSLGSAAAVGVGLAGIVAAGTLLLRRRPADHEPLQPHPPDPSDPAGKPRAESLQVAQALMLAASAAATLGEALSRVAQVLQDHLDARAALRLRVDSWNGETALLRPWPEGENLHADHIDIGGLWAAQRGRDPVAQAMATQSVVVHPLVQGQPDTAAAAANWRPEWATLAIALPVSGDGQLRAVLELYEPRHQPPDLAVLLEIARLQLGLAAEREATRARIETHAEQLGRKQREHQTEQSREYLEALTENLPVSLFVLEPQGFRIVGINRYAELEFGVVRQRLVGRGVAGALGRAVLAHTEPSMRQAIEQRTTVEHDFVHAGRKGDRVINARHFALRHVDGQPRLLISLVRDITERRRAQFALMESELRFRELVESMDDCVFVTTPERDRMLYLGPRTHDIWGLQEDEVRAAPQRLIEHVLPQDRHLFDHRRELEERLQPTDISFRIEHRQHGVRWLRQRTRAQQLPSGEVHVYGLTSDITAEREHELQLQRARDAAEAASRAKSQFMANMSHEIRTPMNGILGMTELLLGTALNDKQRRFAHAVYRSGESLLEIINDILDFAKIEAGRLELAPTTFALRSVVEDTLELLAPRAHEKGLELSFREQPGLPDQVHGDPLRLRQVLTNLVANAIKFTENGEVVVELQCEDAQHANEAGATLWLAFQVRDTGIGIQADVLPRLFNAFTQANSGMAKRYGGTGLGLVISKQLVELMGGHIEVRSSPGIGSVFAFRVPLLSVAADRQAATLELDDMPGLRVLVVEDNETNRTVLENMLTAWGMRVTLAVDGLHALEILHGQHGSGAAESAFDLALIDMNMPRLDGLGLGRALQHNDAHRDLKLILLSSASSPDDARRAQEAGFLRFVAKPLRKAELRQAILGVSAPRNEGSALTPRLNRHILVVEDNPVNQEVIGQMLRRLGCRVHVAGSALEGLRVLCDKKFDLVLMDIQMPGMDGVEALSWFRKGPSGRFAFVTPPGTPVVAVTANALGGDEERFLRLGFDDYLSKPFRQSQLLAMLSKRLQIAAPTEGGEAASAGGSTTAPPGTGAITDTTGVLDAQALQRLRELDPTGENQLMERVLKAFDTSVARLMPQLIESQQSDDPTGVRHVAHTLKSSSASIGAIKLSQICAEIEFMIRQGNPVDLGPRIDAMRAEIELVQSSLRTLLEKR